MSRKPRRRPPPSRKKKRGRGRPPEDVKRPVVFAEVDEADVMPPEVLYEAVDASLSVVNSERSVEGNKWLRYAAGLYYTTDLGGCSVADLVSQPMFEAVPLTTMEKWAVEDRWVDRRRELLARWQAQIEKKIGDRLVQYRVKNLQKMAKIRDYLFRRLTPADHDFRPKKKKEVIGGVPQAVCLECGATEAQHVDAFVGVSGDRAVRALTDLLKLELELSDKVMALTETRHPDAPTAAEKRSRPESLSRDEARRAALAVLAARREKGS